MELNGFACAQTACIGLHSSVSLPRLSMRPALLCWWIAFAVVHCLAAADSPRDYTPWRPVDSIWTSKEADLLSCSHDITQPTGNRQYLLSGQGLTKILTFWRTNQRAFSPLPVVLIVAVYSASCPFSKATSLLLDEVAQQYAKQTIKFLRVDKAELSYSEMIKMGVTATPIVRVHSQATKLTYHGDKTVEAFTEYITNHTGIKPVPVVSASSNSSLNTMCTSAPGKVATARIEDMRALSTAPLTLLAGTITILFLGEAIAKARFLQPVQAWWCRQRHAAD